MRIGLALVKDGSWQFSYCNYMESSVLSIHTSGLLSCYLLRPVRHQITPPLPPNTLTVLGLFSPRPSFFAFPVLIREQYAVGTLVSGREKRGGCYREAPLALISRREGEMSTKTEGRGEIIKKESGWTERQMQKGGEDGAEQQMDGWTAAPIFLAAVPSPSCYLSAQNIED